MQDKEYPNAADQAGGHLRLASNALDYLSSAAEYAAQSQDERSLKYAILHAFAGLELLLKERLRREHWCLLFANVNKAKASLLREGDFHSTGFEETLNRLKNIAGVTLPEEYIGDLRALRSWRNKLQHYAAAISEEQAKGVLAKAFKFADWFVREQLQDLDHQRQEIVRRLADFEEFVESRMQDISDRIKPYQGKLRTCPFCRQRTCLVEEEKVHCFFCGWQDRRGPAWYALVHLSEVLRTADRPKKCPTCGAAPIRRTTQTVDNRTIWYCQRCGTLIVPPR